jgi:6-phosphogluconolactonase (cycloisomerase 2 family)
MHRESIGEPTRRALLSGGAAMIAAQWAVAGRAQQGRPAVSRASPPSRNAGVVYAYVGCYTTAQRYARGDGIHVYRLDLEAGAWSHVQHLGNLVNPSFLLMRPDQRYLYSVHGDETYATSFSVDRDTGQLTPLDRAETGGQNGVHQAIDPAGRFMLVANYSTGNVSVMPVRQDGTLADSAQLVALPGQPGPNRVEQAGSHPHHIVFDPSGRFVVVPDKGLDRVFVFRFDPATGKLTPTVQGSAVARAGSGPRRAAFHPALPVTWILNEISSTVVTYYWEAERGHLRPVQILPALPPDYTGENTSAEIAVSSGGRFVYCSNRGHDSIAIFAADPGTGLLTSVGWVSSQGRTPRFIGFDPSHRFLCAANEQSDSVVTWLADSTTGRLTPSGQVIRNASPVTIAFAVWDA